MGVTPKEAAESIRIREQKNERDLDERFARMTAEAGRIIRAIAEDFRPRRIYQWGSLLDRSRFRAYSDIDIAVEGVEDTADWMRIEKTAWEMTDYPLDLVRIDTIEPEFADIIRTKGVVVYDRRI